MTASAPLQIHTRLITSSERDLFASPLSGCGGICVTKVNDRSDCFRKSENEHGENATYSRFAFSRGELVYVVCGEPSATRTRESIEIAPEQHVVDDYAVCLNHSFSPNLYLQGRQFFALREIKVGEELTFNYLDTETEIASPFTCFSTGQSVNSEARRTPPESSGKA